MTTKLDTKGTRSIDRAAIGIDRERGMATKPRAPKDAKASSKAKAVAASKAVDDAKASQTTPMKRPAKAEPLPEGKAPKAAATSGSGDEAPRKKKPRKYASPLREAPKERTTVPDADLDKIEKPAIDLNFLREEGVDRTPVPSPSSNEWEGRGEDDRKIINQELFGEDDSDSEDGKRPSSSARAPSPKSSPANQSIRTPRHLSYENAPRSIGKA